MLSSSKKQHAVIEDNWWYLVLDRHRSCCETSCCFGEINYFSPYNKMSSHAAQFFPTVDKK